jgi:hypothetical protein
VANTGVRVRVNGLFANNDAKEYTGVNTITFDSAFLNMTLVPSPSGSNLTGTTTVGITGCSTIEILRSTLAYPGNSAELRSA